MASDDTAKSREQERFGMPETGPVILAAYLQTNLRFLERDPALARRTLGLFSEPALQAVRSSSRLAWLPWEYVVESTEAFYRAAGSEAAMIDFTRRALASSLEEPFFRPIVKGGLAILGGSPDRAASWIPTMWKAISRNIGKLEWSTDAPGSGSLRWEGAPRCALDSPIYLRGTAASFLPLFDVCRTTGRIDHEVRDDVIVFSFEWEAG